MRLQVRQRDARQNQEVSATGPCSFIRDHIAGIWSSLISGPPGWDSGVSHNLSWLISCCQPSLHALCRRAGCYLGSSPPHVSGGDGRHGRFDHSTVVALERTRPAPLLAPREEVRYRRRIGSAGQSVGSKPTIVVTTVKRYGGRCASR